MTRLLLPLICFSTAAFAGDGKFTALAKQGKDLYATMSTSKGTIVLRLFSKDAPLTVANFVGLAAGEREFTDPKTQAQVKRPFYDGLVFHRVIEGFMIQGGDPEGTGRGGPGYTFEDEFQSGRVFDKVGLLAMANRGPNTNGSQFFITTSVPTHLNNHHTIFGEVLSGYDVVEAISRTGGPTKAQLLKVTISDKAPKSAAPKGGKQ
ncbi:MAG: peptidylprolyl isomerase [Myxococcota bacterium]